MLKMTDLVISHSMEHTLGVTSASPPWVRGVSGVWEPLPWWMRLNCCRLTEHPWVGEIQKPDRPLKNLPLSSPFRILFQWLFTLLLPFKVVFIDNSSLLISFSFFIIALTEGCWGIPSSSGCPTTIHIRLFRMHLVFTNTGQSLF